MAEEGAPVGAVSTLAGNDPDFADGDDGAVRFNFPMGVAVDAEGWVYVADLHDHCIRKRSPEGQWTTLAGSGNRGSADGQGTAAHFNCPKGIAVDAEGTVFVGDCLNHRLRTVTRGGAVSTLAGSGNSQFADGQGTAASFNRPWGIVVDAEGNAYVADYGNHRIRKVTPQGAVSTFAGSGNQQHRDGQGTAAHFNYPVGLAMDSTGVLHVAENRGCCIRKITPDARVSTLAGSGGSSGFADGQGAAAQFSHLCGLAVDAEGTVFVCDCGNNRIRKITPEGAVSTLAGQARGGYSDDLGAAAQFSHPEGLAIDPSGDLLMADSHRIRRVGAEAVPLGGGGALPVVPSSYTEDMRQMLASPELSDVTFIVEGTKITAHRCLLVARGGEYFSRLLTGEFREAEPGVEIPIEDHTAAGFKSLLEYLYTDQLAFADESVIDVMRLAHKYQLDRPYNHCVRHCRRRISTANAVGWLIQAIQYGLDDLRASTFNFVARSFRSIRSEHKDSLRQLVQYPELMMQVMMEAL